MDVTINESKNERKFQETFIGTLTFI